MNVPRLKVLGIELEKLPKIIKLRNADVVLEKDYLVVRPKIYERYKRGLHGASVLAAEGQLQRAGQVTNVLVDRLIRFVG